MTVMIRNPKDSMDRFLRALLFPYDFEGPYIGWGSGRSELWFIALTELGVESSRSKGDRVLGFV